MKDSKTNREKTNREEEKRQNMGNRVGERVVEVKGIRLKAKG